jgi:phosphatidylserine/phosphatidylglycerophosphate/cardiolipin synthase-like enzyme
MHHLARALIVILIVLIGARPAASQVDVYFTRLVDTTLAIDPENGARHESDVSVVVAAILSSARSTIDVAMYNLNVQRIVDALIAAHRRGVRVRVVAHIENMTNPASRFAQLAANGIPIATNPRGPSGQPQPLMHDKFFIVDGRPGSSETAPTVITGSWNATVAQTFEDANNVVVIRDSALSGAYRAEFEEMWGSTGDAPNADAARFGASKRDNTAHTFTLADGTRVDVWFSPSDAVESHIRDAVSTAQSSIYAATLTITSGVLANQINTQKNRYSADVRVLIENIDDQGGQYGFLSGQLDARSTASVPGLLHHKYAIVDAMPIGSGSVPLVVTGSHNWTYSANTINDENTVVIYSARVANQFLQEFAARYREAGGTRAFGLASTPSERADARTISPNPFGSVLTLSRPYDCEVDVAIVDPIGRIVETLSLAPGVRHFAVGRGASAEGLYLLTLRDCRGAVATLPILRVR